VLLLLVIAAKLGLGLLLGALLLRGSTSFAFLCGLSSASKPTTTDNRSPVLRTSSLDSIAELYAVSHFTPGCPPAFATSRRSCARAGAGKRGRLGSVVSRKDEIQVEMSEKEGAWVTTV
jgi:hypothetical protein